MGLMNLFEGKQLSETQMAKMSIADLNQHGKKAWARYADKEDSYKNRADVQYCMRVLAHIDNRLGYAERIESGQIRQQGGQQHQNQKHAQGGKPN